MLGHFYELVYRHYWLLGKCVSKNAYLNANTDLGNGSWSVTSIQFKGKQVYIKEGGQSTF